MLSKGDLGSAAGVELTGRTWKSFYAWWTKEIEPGLRRSLPKGARMVVPARESNRRGGYPEISEAVYFLAYEIEDSQGGAPGGGLQTVSQGGIGSIEPSGGEPNHSNVKQHDFGIGCISIFALGVITGSAVSIASIFAAFLLLKL